MPMVTPTVTPTRANRWMTGTGHALQFIKAYLARLLRLALLVTQVSQQTACLGKKLEIHVTGLC